jgi:heme-degrading monooxygenase HmoA
MKGGKVMHAILTLFTLGPGTREIADKTGEQFGPVLADLKGFKSVTMFGDYDTGEYGGLSVWETKEDAEAAMAAVGPNMQEALGDMLKGPPTMQVFEVFEPGG